MIPDELKNHLERLYSGQAFYDSLSPELRKHYDEHPYMWKRFKEMLPMLENSEIAIAIDTALNMCPYCHDAPLGCQCWNDE